MRMVPTAGRIAVMIGIAVVAMAVIVFMASVITAVAVVILVALPVLLGDGDCGREGQRQNCRRCGSKPALG